MKKKYITPRAETVDMLCEGLIASSIDEHDVHADTPPVQQQDHLELLRR